MRVIPTDLPEVLLLEPRIYTDSRGQFYEAFNLQAFEDAGLPTAFVQDNVSRSQKNVLRGLHYQIDRAQGKLVRVSSGTILDVVVDLRRRAPTFGRASTFALAAEAPRLLWIPPGFAHGFLVRSDEAEVTYKVTDIYSPAHERTIAWDDPDLAIDWETSSPPILSEKDAKGVRFRDAEVFE